MYGCSLWSLSCKNLCIIECALNKIFRRVWNYLLFLILELFIVLVTFSPFQIAFLNVSIPCYQVLYHPHHLSLNVSLVTLPSVGIPLLVTIFSMDIDI